ncbi:MAG: hypothetical protein HYZ75_02950 [Elusimicrobia bacterium]|nr:hypothetical protein [Elusimicrobiota bacterium]
MGRLLLAAAPAVLFGCAAAFAPARPAWPSLPDGHFMHVGDFLQVTGTGRAAKPSRNETQERSEARDAALLDAWTRLKSYVDALPLEGGGSVYGAARNDAALAKGMERLIYAAQIVTTRYDGPVAAVVVRVDKVALNRLLGTDFK